jgi:hypothetical protein
MLTSLSCCGLEYNPRSFLNAPGIRLWRSRSSVMVTPYPICSRTPPTRRRSSLANSSVETLAAGGMAAGYASNGWLFSRNRRLENQPLRHVGRYVENQLDREDGRGRVLTNCVVRSEPCAIRIPTSLWSSTQRSRPMRRCTLPTRHTRHLHPHPHLTRISRLRCIVRRHRTPVRTDPPCSISRRRITSGPGVGCQFARLRWQTALKSLILFLGRDGRVV